MLNSLFALEHTNAQTQVMAKTGKSHLTGENLLRAVNADTECLFVNNLGDAPKAVATCIRTASKTLRCFSMQASVLTVDILKALSECEKLGSILLENNYFQDVADANSEKYDQALSEVLFCNPTLRCLYVECQFKDNTYRKPVHIFGNKSWSVLGSNSCPLLQLLWVRTIGDTIENNQHVTAALSPPSLIPRQLKICMVNSDMKLRSQVVSYKRR